MSYEYELLLHVTAHDTSTTPLHQSIGTLQTATLANRLTYRVVIWQRDTTIITPRRQLPPPRATYQRTERTEISDGWFAVQTERN